MARVRAEKDYYAILELGTNPTEDEIRKAYRRLALRWHPDRNPGDPAAEERFKEISEAYAVLVDPAKRREYDRLRSVGDVGSFGASREDLFRDLFADPRASAVFEELAREFARMGMRVDHRSFHQTLFGGRTVVTGGVVVITPFTPLMAAFRLARAAMRAGQPGGAERPALGTPGLLGRAVGAGLRFLGLGAAPRAAAPAGGTTSIASGDLVAPLRISSDEAARGGQKRVTLRGDHGPRELLVTIPAGVRSGTKLRLRGQGRPAADRRAGDLYLDVEVAD